MSGRLFLIDGHALIFKMYYAFVRRPMINSKGADMSILYGFTKYLLELINRENPTYLAVAFDPPGGTFRNEIFPAYKANRAETPQLVIDALEPLEEICHSLNIPTLMVKGFEADDVIGTVAKRYGGRETEVYMVTPDKDYGQLVADGICQIKPGKSGGADEVLDRRAICGKYGIDDPSQVIEMLTLCGDTADNVPGVKGVGEVGAAKLISRYGTVKNIYDHISELNPRQQAMFEEARGHIGLSHELVTIKTDVPVDISLEEMALDKSYSTETADLFEKYEFSSLFRYLGDIKAGGKAAGMSVEAEKTDAETFAGKARSSGTVAVVADIPGTGNFTPVRSLTLATVAGGRRIFASGVPETFAALLGDASLTKCGYNLKRICNVLRYNGLEMNGGLSDIELMHYLTDPEKSHKLEILAKSFLGVDIRESEEEAEAPRTLFDMAAGEVQANPADGNRAAAMAMLEPRMREELGRTSSVCLYDNMEEPLIRVLADMEYQGVKVDLGQIRTFTEGLRREVAEREARIREMAGEPQLNVSSPKQVGNLLFGKLNLDPLAKKSSRGAWSTDEATLSAIAGRHPIVDEILEYREVKKLLSTYIEPFPGYVSEVTGKIHTTFNQALTATGRLSSSNPNLQNIPIRSERGKEIRKAFVPSDPAGSILSADYSQIELRIMAHLCGDPHMKEAFSNGVDVHRVTASKIFKVASDEVTDAQRRVAKTANFGIMYGISSFGLAQRLKVSRQEAKSIIDGYFEAFPSIREFIAESVRKAERDGYVETLFGRRRYLPDINAKNATVRALAERNAVNAPIQGTAADIIKIAMVSVAGKIREDGFKSRMALQIHDELLFDTAPGEEEPLKAMVKSEMENVIRLSVPLTVECGYGKNWLEAH